MTEQKNLFLAIALSMLVLIGFEMLFPKPLPPEQAQSSAAPNAGQPAPAAQTLALSPAQALQKTPRLSIDSPKLRGSINQQGALLDDILLPSYRETLTESSSAIRLLSPRDTAAPYWVRFGWLSSDAALTLPDHTTLWQVETGDKLTPQTPLMLVWQSPQNVRFRLMLSLDAHYMLTVQQSVINNAGKDINIFPFAQVARWNPPPSTKQVVFTGPLGVFDNTLVEVHYDDLVKDGVQNFANQQGGWIGFSDEYWLTALLPDQAGTMNYSMVASPTPQGTAYQISATAPGQIVASGESATHTMRLFAGAKEITLLDDYAQQWQIPLFDRAIDFGWFYFLTRPMFYGLHYLYLYVGNFGVAIILLTIVVRLLLAPLAHKSYKALSRMKDLQPKMLELRDKYGDDRMKLNQEMMALYQKEKINPAAGCLPILLQIPVFFALYKVLLVSIEMRHAPFFGWIQDLAAPDPTSIFNLFGLLPYDVPSILVIGIWPILVGVTMFATQKLNPTPPDKIQATVFNMMPILFGIISAHFPAGLAVYWTFNNILSFIQQLIIRKMAGDPVLGRKPNA